MKFNETTIGHPCIILDEEIQMMTLPPSKDPKIIEKPEFETMILKTIPIKRQKGSTRILACAVATNGKGKVGFAEKIAATQKLAEEAAKTEALKSIFSVGPQIHQPVKGKCDKVEVTIAPRKNRVSLNQPPLCKLLIKLIGLIDVDVSGADNTLSFIRAFVKALKKAKNKWSKCCFQVLPGLKDELSDGFGAWTV